MNIHTALIWHFYILMGLKQLDCQANRLIQCRDMVYYWEQLCNSKHVEHSSIINNCWVLLNIIDDCTCIWDFAWQSSCFSTIGMQNCQIKAVYMFIWTCHSFFSVNLQLYVYVCQFQLTIPITFIIMNSLSNSVRVWFIKTNERLVSTPILLCFDNFTFLWC